MLRVAHTFDTPPATSLPEDRALPHWDPAALEEHEDELIARLRAEANAEKESFTGYAFQALSICSAALAGIIGLMVASPLGNQPAPIIGIGAIPILAFALAAAQLGTSAYGGANRAFGYELFLARVRSVPAEAMGRWHTSYRTIEWEAAIRAWRVVQSTLYEEVHRSTIPSSRHKPDFNPRRNSRSRRKVRNKYRRKYDPALRPFWFSQSSLFGQGSAAKWYAGSYLAGMQGLLFLVASIASAILLVTPFAALYRWPKADNDRSNPPLLFELFSGNAHWSEHNFEYMIAAVAFVAAMIGLIVLITTMRRESLKREILEDGLLSIHSCAIVWQAVILAHFNAVERARKTNLTSWDLAKLTQKLSRSQLRQWQSGRVPFETFVAGMNPPATEPGTPDGAGLTGYTFWLGQEAESLARCAIDVPGWIGLGEDELRKRRVIR